MLHNCAADLRLPGNQIPLLIFFFISLTIRIFFCTFKQKVFYLFIKVPALKYGWSPSGEEIKSNSGVGADYYRIKTSRVAGAAHF